MDILHTNVIEITWAAIAIIVLGFAVYGLRESIIDSAFLIANKVNGPRKLTAEMNKREESFRVSESVVMIIYAATALVLPPPPPDYVSQPQTLLGLLAWIMVGALMIIDSLLSRSARRKLQSLVPVEMAVTETVVVTPKPGESKSDLEDRVVEARQAMDQNRRADDIPQRRTGDLDDEITTNIPPSRSH